MLIKVIRKLLADKQYVLDETNIPFFNPAYVINTTHDGRQVPVCIGKKFF